MVRGCYDITLDEERRCFEQGLTHFNERDYFEAHEVWEHAWNGTSGRRCTFYQGLIQIAVALVHYQRQNPLGVTRVFERARTKWADLPAIYMGLDLRQIEASMRPIVELATRALTAPPLVIDPSLLFAIQLVYDPFVEPREERDD